MPFYEYRCIDCGLQDQLVAGLDDHTAICACCAGLMLRINEDLFHPYFDKETEPRKLTRPLLKGKP